MSSVTIEIPENVAVLMKGQPIETIALEAIVLDLYRRAAISSGKAAQLLGMGRIEFIQSSGRLGIPSIHMSPEEFDAEVAAAKTL
jgi:predicted HTH domain antitoxin